MHVKIVLHKVKLEEKNMYKTQLTRMLYKSSSGIKVLQICL